MHVVNYAKCTEEFVHGAKMKKSAAVTTTARFVGCHLRKMVLTQMSVAKMEEYK